MKLSRRDLILSAGGTLFASVMPARGAGMRTLQGPALGASWTLVTADLAAEADIQAAIEKIIARVDGAMSPFRADSELSRFNRATTSDWHPLSTTTCAVVTEALRIAALTENAFNPTFGPLVGRYGFGPIRDGLPGLPEEITVRVDAARKARPQLSLDLCGIAKGYALDHMAAACIGLGLANFLVELGGEMFAAGRHPSGRSWQVGIERPNQAGGIQRVVALEGVFLATSGSAINGYAYRGRHYSHIIDPATAKPADTALASVTVAAKTAARADALATALFAMGPDRGPDFAHRKGIEALFILDDSREISVAGFNRRVLV